MKKNYKISKNQKLTAYSAMAAAIMAHGYDANAEVVYTDFEDVTLEVGDAYDLDLDGDGVLDFDFAVGSITGSNGTWSFGTAFGMFTGGGGSNNQIIGYTGAYYNYGSNLNAGDEIGPDGPWLAYSSVSNAAVLASNFYGISYGDFPGAGEGYIGVQFEISGKVHYGWVRLEADINDVFITLKDMAYENVAETAIDAGATTTPVAIPEISASLVNVYSFGSTLYINNTGMNQPFVNVYDLNGKLVLSQDLTGGNNVITMEQLAEGNYLVNIKSEEGSFTKQVFMN
jgi:hypothetical protein